MSLSNNVNRTVKQLPKDIYINLKKPMLYVVTGSLFLIAGMQIANAATCAPDVKYLLPQLNNSDVISEVNESSIENYINAKGGKEKASSYLEGDLSSYKHGSEGMDTGGVTYKFFAQQIKYDDEMLKQIKCHGDGGKVASSSADFDANGNYTGSTQQASNKKSKSGKSNNQEQVASANSNENSTNSADSNNAESSDAKSKGKEFAKDDKRLHANSCVSVRREKNQLYGAAFKNICPYPIEVIWCSNSKEDPNQCDRGWYGRSNFGVGHSEPIDSAHTATHWIFSACKGEDSIFTNDQMKPKRQHRCVKWNN